eukprot:2473252-Rhodomonas_salina.3
MQQAVFRDAMCSSEPRRCSEWQSNEWGAKFTGSDRVTSVFGLCIASSCIIVGAGGEENRCQRQTLQCKSVRRYGGRCL